MKRVSENFRKNIKKPDKFQIIGTLVLDYLYRHRIKIALIVAVIVVVGVGMIFGSYLLSRIEKQRAEELAKINKELLDEEINIQNQKKQIQQSLNKIEETLNSNNSDKNKKLTKKALLKLKEEKDQYLQQLEALKVNYDKYIPLYNQYFNKYKNYTQGWGAGIKLVSMLIDKGELDKAQNILSTIENLSKNNKFYQYYTNYLQGDLLFELGKYDEALALIDKVIALAPVDLKADCLLKKAYFLLKLDKKDEVLNILDLIMKDYTGTEEYSSAVALKMLVQRNVNLLKK